MIQKEQVNKSIIPVRIKSQTGQGGDPVASHITPFWIVYLILSFYLDLLVYS